MKGLADIDFTPARIASLDPLEATALAGHFDIGLVGDMYLRDEYLRRFGIAHVADLKEELWGSLAGASLIVANLEAPITSAARPLEDKPYLHKTSPAVLDVFDGRFVLSLANNHIMDYGPAGLIDTLNALDAAGVAYAGAGRDIEEASSPCRLVVAGTQLAVFCAADPRFCPATANAPGTCPAERDLLTAAVRAARREGVLVVVSLHMGLEHIPVPSLTQVALAKACLEAGAMVVHFHHSHCLGGLVADDNGVVLLGTGNYVFTQPIALPSSRSTATLRVRVARDFGKIVAVGATPARIDARGLPVVLHGSDAEEGLRDLRRLSQIPLRDPGRRSAQLKAMAQPGFLRMNARNYASILRKRGPFYLLKILKGGVRAQLGRPLG